jgi:T-complex protein 1 subunit delta
VPIVPEALLRFEPSPRACITPLSLSLSALSPPPPPPKALEIIPYTLAENAGINPIALVTELRNKHNGGDSSAGIDVRRGAISNMWNEKVVQPLLVNLSEISLATECVGMILKIDDLIPVR